MITQIIQRLKEGSIKKVILFGDGAKVPPPPYVVVREERDAAGENRQIRIRVHADQGNQDVLQKYLFGELPKLLDKRTLFENGEGAKNRLIYAGDWSGVSTLTGDNTIFMEKMYLLPSRLR